MGDQEFDMKHALLYFLRRVGVVGLLIWMFMIGTYLSVRWRDGSWRWLDLVKYTGMVMVVSYFGRLRKEEESPHFVPYLICTSCGKKHTDPGMVDPTGWLCGHCHKETLVRVGQRRSVSKA